MLIDRTPCAACGRTSCDCDHTHKEAPMAKLTDLLRSVAHRSFFADDKDQLAQIVKDAEKNGNGNGKKDDDDHDEPDGDEGTHIHLHMEGKDGAKTGDEQDPDVESRLKNVEDAVKAIPKTVRRAIRDAFKDGELPEALKKHQFGANGNGDDDDDDDKGDDDGDDKEETKDAPDADQGAMTASDPGSVAGAELMEADPALKTGKSMMGDKKMVGRWNTALANYVRDNAARAEVLSPGIKITGQLDHGGIAKIKDTGKAICDLRRGSILKALTTDTGKAALGPYVTPASVKVMSCDAIRMAFLQGSDNMRQMNNDQGRAQPGSTWTGDDPRSFREKQTKVLQGINSANAKFWAEQTGRPN